MPVTLFITIDTEEDLWAAWSRKDNPVKNIRLLPVLQDIFNRYGAIPTYLVNFPVVNNEESCGVIKMLRDNHACEIGTHIHPWNTPPFVEDINAKNTMICNLAQELIHEKIEKLHSLIKNSLGLEPKCFRAGRWAFGSNVASSILDLGYKVDTSITPFCDWTEEDGPDFSEAGPFPYRFDPSSIFLRKLSGCLLEIPPTIGFWQKNAQGCAQLRKAIQRSPLAKLHILGVLDKLRLLNFRWLSPENTTGSDMIQLASRLVRRGHKCLNMSFHSPSLLPGKTPFVKDEYELKAILKHIEIFLEFAVDAGFAFAPLTSALDVT